MSEFTTARTDISASVSITESAKFLGIPIGDTNLVYEGVSTVRAGIDIKQLELVEVNNSEHKIYILMPPPKITEVFLDVNHSSTLADYRNWFEPKSGGKLYDQAQGEAMAKIRQKSCANHILDAANANAKQLIESILTKVGFTIVEIDTQTSQGDSCLTA